jgi:predicted metal-binding protein
MREYPKEPVRRTKMDRETRSDKSQYASLETIFGDDGFADFWWIAPEQIVVAQWVRMKCMFGCSNYGRKGACPPQTLEVSDCERFSREYSDAVVFHLRLQEDNPEGRIGWYREMAFKLVELERKAFLAGFERACMLLFGGCYLCQGCTREKSLCKLPEKARPAPEGLAVDVFSTVKKLGYPISVLTDPAQAADRYVFLMVE